MTGADGEGLRVLHVAETLPGGVATYLGEVLPWQRRRAGPGRIALLAPADQLDSLEPAVRDGVVTHGYRRSGRNPASLWALFRALQRVLAQGRVDLVHLHSSFAGVVGRLWRRVPVVYCPHGWAFSREGSALARRAYQAIEWSLQTRAEAIVAVSAHERDAARRAGLSADCLALIAHGLSPSAVVPPPRRLKAAGAPLELLFIGRFDRQKGLDWLLAALPADRVRLSLAGAAVVDAPPELVARPEVRLLGWLSPEGIARALDEADALIVPSRWEAFGLVVLEAMRRGVPVLVSDRGALPEVVGEAGLIFDLDTPASLPAQLDSLTPSRLQTLGEAGRARFEAHYQAERMNEQTWALYQSIWRERAGHA